jgi:Zn-dependent protease/predicted transcriptional regulator
MRSYTVGRVWGIPIRISISLVVFLPVLAWLIGSGEQIAVYGGLIEGLTGVQLDVTALRAGNTPWLVGALAAVGLFVSVTLHELGHSWVALRYDIGIESITLWILGGVAALESIPKEWDREFRIAIAGPLVSVATAAACWAVLVALPASLTVPRFVFGWLAVTNVTLTVFNLLPAFPMDGGRILRALLARTRPYDSATRLAARIGVVFAILFAVVGVLSFSPLLVLLALFVYGAATTESRTVILTELLAGLTVGDVMTRSPATVDADATVEDIVGRMLRERQAVFPVVDGDTVVGVVSVADLRGVAPDDRATTAVRSVAADVPKIAARTDAFEALAAMRQSNGGPALVVDDSGLVGVLSESDFAHAMQVQRGFTSGAVA